MKKSKWVFIIISIAFLFQIAYAWNLGGHSLHGVLTYTLLTPEKRTAILDIIKFHPRYKEDFISAMPDSIKIADEDTKGKWTFARMATWPDLTRGFEGDNRSKYSHSSWHYINLPIYLDAQLEKEYGEETPGNTERNFTSDSDFDNLNIMQALDFVTIRLNDKNESIENKAVWLCWLFHLVGDLHQPCHSTAIYTANLFKNGDRGGNLISVGDRKSVV